MFQNMFENGICQIKKFNNDAIGLINLTSYYLGNNQKQTTWEWLENRLYMPPKKQTSAF